MVPSIPYDLTIADRRGVILANGHDVSRIGQIHLGAVEALNRNSIVRIWDDDGDQKRGISIPLVYKNRPVGVIAVEGSNVHEIEKIIGLVKTCAEMLIAQASILSTEQLKQQLKDQFLYEWVYYDGEYAPEFVERGHACGFDILLSRSAITIFSSDEQTLATCIKGCCNIIESNDGAVRLSADKYAVLVVDNYKLGSKMEKLCDLPGKFKLAIGMPNTRLSVSVQESLQAIDIGQVLFPKENLYRAEDLLFTQALLQDKNNGRMASKIDDLVEYGDTADLLGTLLTYIEQDGEIQKTADKLNIHRNSLGYRLKRIADITGKNPRKYFDLLYLYCAYIAYAFRDKN